MRILTVSISDIPQGNVIFPAFGFALKQNGACAANKSLKKENLLFKKVFEIHGSIIFRIYLGKI